MNLDAGRNMMYKAYKTLGERWASVQMHWQDAVQKDFTRQHWDSLEQRVVGLLGAVDRLAQVLAKVKQDCS